MKLTFSSTRRGRSVDGVCKPPARQSGRGRGRSCTYPTTIGALTVSAHAGRNKPQLHRPPLAQAHAAPRSLSAQLVSHECSRRIRGRSHAVVHNSALSKGREPGLRSRLTARWTWGDACGGRRAVSRLVPVGCGSVSSACCLSEGRGGNVATLALPAWKRACRRPRFERLPWTTSTRPSAGVRDDRFAMVMRKLSRAATETPGAGPLRA